MTSIIANPVPYHPWLHRWAVLTAVIVFPLVISGGTVTTLRVGMVDSVALRPPWYMLVISWTQEAAERGIGYLIEHGHRQIGWIVGVLTICLAASLWRAESRRWLRWLGIAALVAVSFQGILGILRVRWHVQWGIELAMVHGCVAQLVFCLLAGIALVTSRGWCEGAKLEASGADRLQSLCCVTTALLVVQLVLGVWLRQVGVGLWVHVLVAFAVAGHAIMLAIRVLRRGLEWGTMLRRPALVLAALVGIQIAIGFGAWLAGAGTGAIDYQPITPGRAILATAHMGTSALMLATSFILTLRSFGHLASPRELVGQTFLSAQAEGRQECLPHLSGATEATA